MPIRMGSAACTETDARTATGSAVDRIVPSLAVRATAWQPKTETTGYGFVALSQNAFNAAVSAFGPSKSAAMTRYRSAAAV
jgi:hypothetical protein